MPQLFPRRPLPLLLYACLLLATVAATARAEQFVNPILEGADPWVIRHGESYYLVQSEGQVGVSLRESDNLTRWGDRHVIWQAPEDTMYSKEVWAPKLFRIDDRWYIYTAASDGENRNHRMWVFESETDDPLSPYTNKGELYTGDHIETGEHNRWAIDGIVFEHEGRRYFVWSGWPDEGVDVQYLYIAEMSNPWTITTNRVKLADNADYVWERVAEDPEQRGLHEGPQILKRDGRLFLIYSCSASWLPTYKLGMLELEPGGDPMNADHWRKHDEPVFAPTEQTYGIGHNSFTTSPDGSEHWIVYHAKVDREPGWRRAIYAQPFGWSEDGRPEFGRPVAAGEPLDLPAGQPESEPLRTLEETFDTEPLDAAWGYYGHHRFMDVREGGLHLGLTEFQNPAYIYHNGEKVVRHDFEAADLEVTTRLRFIEGERDAGILFRVQQPGLGYDAQRGYFAGLIPGSQRVILGKMDGENWHELARASAEIDAEQWHRLTVRAENERIEVSLNGERVIDHEDGSYASGSVGLRVVDTHAVFDRIEAEALEPAAVQP